MKTTKIADFLSPDLGSRAQARGFRRFVDENYSGDAVTVDFSGVQFSSRAFMDEFYNLFLAPAVSSEAKVEVEVANRMISLLYWHPLSARIRILVLSRRQMLKPLCVSSR